MNPLDDWTAAGAPAQAASTPMTFLRDPYGARYAVLTARPGHQQDPALQQGLAEVEGFLRDPGVPGLAPLVRWDQEEGSLVYPLDRGVLLSDLVHARRFYRGPHPPRAALELLAHLGPLLDHAAAAAAAVGRRSHGALTPWHVVLHAAHAVSVIGYGVPAREVGRWLEEGAPAEALVDAARGPGPALRYAPPERLDGRPEDVRADIYAAVACAAELVTGQPLLVQSPTGQPALPDQIRAGGAAERARQLGDALPVAVRDLLARGLAPDPEERLASGQSLADQAQVLLAGLSPTRAGPSVFVLVQPLAPTDGGAFTDFDDEEDVGTEIIEPSAARPTPAHSAVTQVKTLDADSPVPDPEIGADLAAVRAQARQIVARTQQLSAQAAELAQEVAERAGTSALEVAILRRAYDAAQRASRAAEAASQSGDLLLQDHDAAAARITLDLVRTAEAQCASASDEATAQRAAIEQHLQKEASRTKALADAVGRAASHARAASEAADEADALITGLEEAQARGEMRGRGGALAVDHASLAADQAHRLAEEAQHHHERASTTPAVELALRHAEAASRADDRAQAFLEETQRAAEHARRLEAQARAGAVSDARQAATSARLAAATAQRAAQQADAFAPVVPEGDRDRAAKLMAECRQAAEAGELAATLTARASQEADDQASAAEAHEKAQLAGAALERTQQEVQRALQATDALVSLAGAAGAPRAQLNAVGEEAEALLGRARLASSRASEELEGLLAQAGALSGAQVVRWREAAQAARDTAAEHLPEIEKLVRSIKVAMSVETAQRRFPALEQAVAGVQAAAAEAREAVGQAWEAAEAEIVEQRRRSLAERTIRAAHDAARAHANACQRLLIDAREVAEATSAAVADTPHEEAQRLYTRALEAIDIAGYQAGEADTAARQIPSEQDPTEARALAQTALSFFERISADLPGAVAQLEQAAQLARGAVTTLARVKEEASAGLALVSHFASTSASATEAARVEAADWHHLPAIAASLSALTEAVEAFAEDAADARSAHDAAQTVDDPEAATRLLADVDAVVARAQDRRRDVDAYLTHISRAVSEARADREAQEEARALVARAIDAVLQDLQRVQGAAASMHAAIAEHRADGEPVLDAQDQMAGAIRDVEAAAEALSTLGREVAQSTAGARARARAGVAQEHRDASQRAVEAAAEAETAGVAAAEAEGRARSAAEQRAHAHAKSETEAAEERLGVMVEQLLEALTQAEQHDFAALSVAPPERAQAARASLEQAAALADQVRDRHRRLVEAKTRLHQPGVAAEAEALAARARADAEEGADLSRQAFEGLQSAVDMARASVAEAEAIRGIRAELRDLGARATATAVQLDRSTAHTEQTLQEAARLLPSAADASDATGVRRDLEAAAADAREAAAVVHRAEAASGSVSTLAAAEDLLTGARQALQQLDEAVHTLAGLQERAQEAVSRAQRAATEALEAVRVAAAEPAQQAVAAARKAEGWLVAGRREAREAGLESALDHELALLARAARQAVRSSDAVTAGLRTAEEASSVDEARDALEPVTREAAAALTASEAARSVLERVRERIGALVAEAEALSSIVQEAAVARARTSQLADGAEARLQGLEARVSTAEVPKDVRGAVETLRTAAAQARLAAGRAATAMQRARGARTPADAREGADGVAEALHQAEQAVQQAIEAEAKARSALDAARTEARQVRSLATERQRAAPPRAQPTGPDAERGRARRERVDRRREERAQRGLLDMGAPSGEAGARGGLYGRTPPPPEPRGAHGGLYGGRPAAPSGGFQVRSWSPEPTGSEGTDPSADTALPGRPSPAGSPRRRMPTEPPAPAREVRPSTASTEDDATAVDSRKVDALLERLRAKRHG